MFRVYHPVYVLVVLRCSGVSYYGFEGPDCWASLIPFSIWLSCMIQKAQMSKWLSWLKWLEWLRCLHWLRWLSVCRMLRWLRWSEWLRWLRLLSCLVSQMTMDCSGGLSEDGLIHFFIYLIDQLVDAYPIDIVHHDVWHSSFTPFFLPKLAIFHAVIVRYVTNSLF